MAPLLSAIVDNISDLMCWHLILAASGLSQVNQNLFSSVPQSNSSSWSNLLNFGLASVDVCGPQILQGSTTRIHNEVSLGCEKYGSSKFKRYFLSAGW